VRKSGNHKRWLRRPRQV